MNHGNTKQAKRLPEQRALAPLVNRRFKRVGVLCLALTGLCLLSVNSPIQALAGETKPTTAKQKTEQAAESIWGDLTLRFVYDGKPPEPRVFDTDKIKPIYGKPIHDESLLVNDKNRGIANVVVYLLPKKGEKLAVHPSYQHKERRKAVLTLCEGRFEPHVLLFQSPSTLVIESKGHIGYNPSIEHFKNARRSTVIPSGKTTKEEIEKEESYPVRAKCNVHPWISGYVLARSNPYMAKSNKDGLLEIKNLPIGEHEFQLWHERIGRLNEVPFDNQISSKKGRVKVTIAPGPSNVKEISLLIPPRK